METTEELIKRTAKRVFFGEGKVNARMQDISGAAGINRALLHYYFRNRDTLFELVLREALDESFIKMFSILSTDKPFEAKVTSAIHHIIDCLTEYPFIENFIISEINKNPDNENTKSTIRMGKAFTKDFLKEIETYLRKNKLPLVSPQQFIVNMMSLCAYPSSTKPIVKNILGLTDKQYRDFLAERKKLIPKLVLMKS